MMHAVVVDRVGDPPLQKERLLRVVRPGELPWTWVLQDEEGREIVRHHDGIANGWDLARKRSVGPRVSEPEDWNAGAVVISEQVGGTDGKRVTE